MKTKLTKEKILSTYDVAQQLGVAISSVIVWCKTGKLPSFKTPGGHRRIQASELVRFMKKFNMPVPRSLKSAEKVTCLLVDDDPQFRKVTLRILKSLNPLIKVEEAEDGFEAGQKISETLPNLVLLDLNLPGMDGYKVCESIRKNKRLRHTRIIAISGDSDLETKKKVLNCGADAFLPKPIDTDSFAEKVNAYLFH